MEVGGGSDEEQSTEEQRHGTKRARSEEETIDNQKAPLNSSEPITKKRRTQESSTQAGNSPTNISPQTHQNSGLQQLVKWTCEHLLYMNKGRTYQIGDSFTENTFAQFRNALEQAIQANAPELVQKLLETGMQNCVPDALDQALVIANSVGAEDVIALLSRHLNVSSSSSASSSSASSSSASSSSSATSTNSTTSHIVADSFTPPPVPSSAPEAGWQKRINAELDYDNLEKINDDLRDPKKLTLAYTILFGEKIENWPPVKLRALILKFFEPYMQTLFTECGAVCLEDCGTFLVLFSSDFDLVMFRGKLFQLHEQEQTLLQNQRDNQGTSPNTTALMLAAFFGDLVAVQMLLQNGACPGATNIVGLNALMLASSKGHIEIVSLLLTYPINVNAKNSLDFTALGYAIKGGFLSICRLLFQYGASLDDEEQCPLTLAARHGCTDMYKLLIEKGADIHQPTTNKSTPLGTAVAAGNLDACKLLLSLGADINHIDDFDFSILDLAVASGNPEIVEYLLNAGLTLSNFDKKKPPLVVATTKKYIDTVKILLAHGAEINQADEFGRTALSLSCANKSLELARLLIYAGANPNEADLHEKTPLVYAASCGSIELVKLLISHGAQLFSQKNYGYKALEHAVQSGHIEVASHLLQLHVPTELVSFNNDARNFIIQSIGWYGDSNNLISMLMLLIQHGASLKGVDERANDALMNAVMYKKPEVISFLFKQGAKIGQINKNNQNALHIAMDALNISASDSGPTMGLDSDILVSLLIQAQIQSDWFDLRKQAINRHQHPLTRELILLSWAWPLVAKDFPIENLVRNILNLKEVENFIQFSISASPEILTSQKIDYMLSLAGVCPPLIGHIRPYIEALPQIKTQLFGNSSTIHASSGVSFFVGIGASLEFLRDKDTRYLHRYKDELADQLIFKALNQVADIELNQLIDNSLEIETSDIAPIFSTLFEICLNSTFCARTLHDKLPAYTVAKGSLANALVAKGMFWALATKIEAAWDTAWSQFVGITISSNSGSSSNSSSGSNSISSVSSQAPITAFHPDDPLGLFDDDLLSQWIEELPEAPSQPSFLDPVQSQALLQVFRDELRLTLDSVGGNIIDLPKATKEAYKIYVDLILRQLYMLNQFIQAK